MPEKPIKSIAGLLSVVEFERRYFPRTFEAKLEESNDQPARLELESPRERIEEIKDFK